MESKRLIEKLQLQPHPEGGYFREIYRSRDTLSFEKLNKGHSGLRNLATSIYYLLEPRQVSRLHRLRSDEIWYYHAGSAMKVVCLQNGNLEELLLGPYVEQHQMPQIVLEAGTIFGAYPAEPNSFSLAGCMVTPGFDFADFEFVDKTTIARDYRDYLQKLEMLL